MFLKKIALFATLISIGITSGALADCTFWCRTPDAIMIERNEIGQTDPVQYCVFSPSIGKYQIYTITGSGVGDQCQTKEQSLSHKDFCSKECTEDNFPMFATKGTFPPETVLGKYDMTVCQECKASGS